MDDVTLFLGIDVGTSGCRALAIDGAGREVASVARPMAAPRRAGAAVEQEPAIWWHTLTETVTALLGEIDRSAVAALALDATSGTVLLIGSGGAPVAPALMYSDNRAVGEAARIATAAPPTTAAHGTGSGLAKLLWLQAHHGTGLRACTQADWLNLQLSGAWFSDDNNALKSGYDPVTRRWPDWLPALSMGQHQLPPVHRPGTSVSRLRPALARRWGLPPGVRLVAGTTDSTAAILAAGATEPGDAVTSLGSTLVTKVISDAPLFAPEFGIYAQPLGDHWLIGGGSNSGGAVLKAWFSETELEQLSARMDPDQPTGLDYYPLLSPGERFPVNDPTLPPRLTPRPADDGRFLQGMLESMARIEQAGYRKLADLGAPYPKRVFSVGGGAGNRTWSRIRERTLGVPLCRPRHDQAAYGAALLARAGAAI